MKIRHTLSLQVINNEKLASGKLANITLDANGGSIGSADSNDWIIQNQLKQIDALHAKIELIDSQFCISAYAPNVYLNGIDLFNQKRPVLLQQGDVIQIGDLNINVQINIHGQIKDSTPTDPEAIISNNRNPINEILTKETSSFINQPQEIEQHNSELIKGVYTDPLKVLSSDNEKEVQPNYKKRGFSQDSGDILNQFMQSDSLRTPTQQYDKTVNFAINPLLDGLAHSIHMQNSEEAFEFLEEIGQSINITVNGLKELHKTHTQLSNKQLHPTEDNPLRLELDYNKTLEMLYSRDKHPVHLSATAAIEESLLHIQLHYKANTLAISEALSTLLQAFSPQALISRFQRYCRRKDIPDNTDSWAWEMYSSYFDELTSDRQKGFDKLFWQIYEQSYDHHIRRLLIEHETIT